MTTPTAATIVDVEDLLGRSLSTESARIGRLIVRAEGTLSMDMPGLTFGEGTETVTLEGDGDDVITLPRYPVTAVASVTVDDIVLDPADYRFNVLGQLHRRYSGIGAQHDSGFRGRWPDAGVDIVVTYSFGWGASAVPPAVTGIVAELVARRVANPEQIVQQSVGDRSQTFAGASPDTDRLTPGQTNLLRNWRRNRAASVRVRT